MYVYRIQEDRYKSYTSKRQEIPTAQERVRGLTTEDNLEAVSDTVRSRINRLHLNDSLL